MRERDVTVICEGMDLPERQKKFADYYLADPNATKAAIRAGFAERSAHVTGATLLKNPKVQAYLAVKRDKLEARTEITQDMVLERWWQLANADPNDLIKFRRVSCRYCFGEGHAYQWADAEEFAAAMDVLTDGDPIPDISGGFGYDHTIAPHPKCPKCKGEGHGQIHAEDTRNLTGGAAILYAGVKQTRDGFEIKMHDQLKALEMVARHKGMFLDRVDHTINAAAKVSVDEMRKMDPEAAARAYKAMVGGGGGA